MTNVTKKEPLEYGEITGYKCGELFVSQRGIFYLNCHFCDKTFFQLNYFATHFLEEHNFDIQESTVELPAEDQIEYKSINENCFTEDETYLEESDTKESFGNKSESQELQLKEEDILAEVSEETFLDNDEIIEKILSESVTNNLEPNLKVEIKLETSIKCLSNNVECNKNADEILLDELIPEGKERCKLCRKVFTKAGMRVHLTRHLELFKCDAVDCKQRFQHQVDLDAHIINEHRNNLTYPFHCTACPRSFRLKIRLQQHFRRFHMREKNFKCSFCGKCFFLKNELKNHETFHTGIKTHVCDQCGKTFAVRQRLINHMKAVHPTGQYFKCEQCDKKFNHPDILNRHQQCHIEGKPFKCELCSKTFKRKHSLKGHIDVVHMHLIKKHLDKDRNYFCDICGRGFIQKRNLSFHKKSH